MVVVNTFSVFWELKNVCSKITFPVTSRIALTFAISAKDRRRTKKTMNALFPSLASIYSLPDRRLTENWPWNFETVARSHKIALQTLFVFHRHHTVVIARHLLLWRLLLTLILIISTIPMRAFQLGLIISKQEQASVEVSPIILHLYHRLHFFHPWYLRGERWMTT